MGNFSTQQSLHALQFCQMTFEFNILGTVIVQPEAVDEPKKEEYKGPEWKATKRLSRSGNTLTASFLHKQKWTDSQT